MNPRFSQLLLIIAMVTAVLAVMYLATRPAKPSAAPDEQPEQYAHEQPAERSPPPEFINNFNIENPSDLGFDISEFKEPEFEPLPDNQLRIFQNALSAIQNQDTESLQTMLSESPQAALWASEGATLLLLTIQEQNEPALRALIDAGADVNYSNGIGATPLIDAIAFDWPDAVPILLDAGAGIDSPTGIVGQTPLMIAAEIADVASMRLLLDRGADIDTRNDLMNGETALFCAVNSTQPDSVRFLLDAGADAAITNSITQENAEQTALHMYNNELFEDKDLILAVIEAFEAEPDLDPAAD